MKTNETLKKEVEAAIQWEPLLHTTKIDVSAVNGVVTLTGLVDNYAQKSEATQATERTDGVKAVIENLVVRNNISVRDGDGEIVNHILNAFKWNWMVPEDKVQVMVESGWVTLNGEVNWNYQKEAAEKSVEVLSGITGLTNNITIKAAIKDEIEKEGIETAMQNNWAIRDRNIKVNFSGTAVTLKGTVNSQYEKIEAGRIGWNAPGVCSVKNELMVSV